MRESDFIDQSRQATSPEALVSLMQSAADELGFDRFAYCALSGCDRHETGDTRMPAVAYNYPEDWVDYYLANNCSTRDPVILHAPDLDGAYLWNQLGTDFELNHGQQTLMNEAGDAGLRDGVGVPLHGARGKLSLMSFASSDGHPEPDTAMQKLHVLATQFHFTYRDAARTERTPPARIALTERETEILSWIAGGKTSWEIGMIMTISENTVNFHIRNALQKLGANSRIYAVVKAIRYRLISLNAFEPPT